MRTPVLPAVLGGFVSAARSAAAPRRLPLQLVGLGVALTLGVCGGLLWVLDQVDRSHGNLASDTLLLSRLSGRMAYLDEVLTSSAQLAVTTGDPEWRARYREHEPHLDATIAEAIRWAPDAFTERAARDLEDSNHDLVDLELLAFDLAEDGRAGEGTAILASAEYARAKRLFRAGLDSLRGAIELRSVNAMTALHLDLQRSILGGTAGLALLALVWLLVIGVMRRALTARDASERALEAARVAAEEGTARKARFLASMSHEIRTPMNGVLGMAQLLRETRLDEEQRETLDVIEKSGQTLLTIIDDILDLSKIEAGQLELEAIPFDLGTCVSDVCSLLSFRAREKGLHLRHFEDPGLPGQLLGDPTRVRQILTNLVTNAVKFTDAGGVDVTTVARPRDDGRLDVLIQVRDTGVGIPAERIDRLFKDYAQAEASTSRHYGGTGLGLSICRQLVERMGGEIGVASQVGEGTTFTVLLPLGAAVAPPAGPAGAGAAAAADGRLSVRA